MPPPFLYGIRNPLVSGLIRFNEDISKEAKRVITTEYFNKTLVDLDDCDTIEVVSDDSVARADDPTHIEAGVGVVVKTSISTGPEQPVVPCGIVSASKPVGERNNSMLFHANQAKTICEYYAREYVGDRGIILLVKNDGEKLILENNLFKYNFMQKINNFFSQKNEINEFKIDKINNYSFLSNYIHFPTSLSLHALIDRSDNIVCGGKCLVEDRKLIITDPFVTMDCMEGSEKESFILFAQKVMQCREFARTNSATVRYVDNDRIMTDIFGKDESRVISRFSLQTVGFSPQEDEVLRRRPWLTSGIV